MGRPRAIVPARLASNGFGFDRRASGKLDDELKDLARRNEVAWRLMSVLGVGPVVCVSPSSRLR
jgi:hypothetical protein